MQKFFLASGQRFQLQIFFYPIAGILKLKFFSKRSVQSLYKPICTRTTHLKWGKLRLCFCNLYGACFWHNDIDLTFLSANTSLSAILSSADNIVPEMGFGSSEIGLL